MNGVEAEFAFELNARLSEGSINLNRIPRVAMRWRGASGCAIRRREWASYRFGRRDNFAAGLR